MLWSDEASTVVEQLLHHLPEPVRGSVRESAEGRAEALSEEIGDEEVSTEAAVQAFVESTPADLRERLKHGLLYLGIDPDDYHDAFAA